MQALCEPHSLAEEGVEVALSRGGGPEMPTACDTAVGAHPALPWDTTPGPGTDTCRGPRMLRAVSSTELASRHHELVAGLREGD